MLSKPGNPNLIISATLLYPLGGSAGMRSLGFSGINGTAGSVIAGDITTAEAAETVPETKIKGDA